MKKKFINFLVIALVLANTSLINIPSVKAATTDDTNVTANDTTGIKVSLDTIRDIMNENNLDIKVYYNNQKVANKQYQIARDAVPDAKAALETASSNVTSANNTYNSNPTTDNEKTLKDAKDAETKAKASLTAAETTLDTKRYALKTASIQYQQNIETAIQKAEQQYIDYLSTLTNMQLEEDKVGSQAKDLKIAKIQYDSGFISKNDYITATQNNTDEVNKLNELEDKEDLAKTKLFTTLGLSIGDKVIINTDFNEDLEKIAKINYEDDLSKMLDSNIDIRLENISIDKLNDDIDAETTTSDDTDEIDKYNTDNANIALNQKVSTAKTDFKSQYNTLMSSYNSIKSSYDKIIQAQKDYQTTQTKYDLGFISQNDVDDAKLALDTKINTFNSDKNTLYVNYLRYIQMKEGY